MPVQNMTTIHNYTGTRSHKGEAAPVMYLVCTRYVDTLDPELSGRGCSSLPTSLAVLPFSRRDTRALRLYYTRHSYWCTRRSSKGRAWGFRRDPDTPIQSACERFSQIASQELIAELSKARTRIHLFFVFVLAISVLAHIRRLYLEARVYHLTP